MTLYVKPMTALLTRNTELISNMDPYVILKLGSQKWQTRTHKEGGKKPKWNETFKFISKQTKLSVTVMDQDTFSDDTVGSCEIDLTKYYNSSTQEQQYFSLTYKGKSAGKIYISFRYDKGNSNNQGGNQQQNWGNNQSNNGWENSPNNGWNQQPNNPGNNGWGNQPPNSGWGNQQNIHNSNWGNQPNIQNSNWGNQQPQNSGWGNQQPQNSGWGNQPQNSGWGNQQQPQNWNQPVQPPQQINAINLLSGALNQAPSNQNQSGWGPNNNGWGNNGNNGW